MAEGLRFERFNRARHQREPFDCGDASLNEYLKKRLNQQMKKGMTVGYVLADEDGRIAGYFTLSNGRLPVGIVPPAHDYPITLPLPTTLIGRLAVDLGYRGRGLGQDLLIHALKISVRQAEHIASAVVEVDAMDESAGTFYARFGFTALADDRLHLYLRMADAKAVVDRFASGSR